MTAEGISRKSCIPLMLLTFDGAKMPGKTSSCENEQNMMGKLPSWCKIISIPTGSMYGDVQVFCMQIDTYEHCILILTVMHGDTKFMTLSHTCNSLNQDTFAIQTSFRKKFNYF